jgi:hypothetical protein
MRLELFATLLLPVIGVFAQSTCTWHAYGPDESGILSDVSAVRTLYVVEAIYYANCTGQVATAYETAIIDGTTFTASPPATFTFVNPESYLFVTQYYPEVTLTSLTQGEVLTFTQTVGGLDTAIDGSGLFSITVPIQVQHVTPTGAYSTVTQTISISTTSTTTKSTGVSAGAVGGIAAGIVVGFLIIGAGAFFLLFYKPRQQHVEYPGEQGYQAGGSVTEPKNPTAETYQETGVNPVGGRLSYPE